ncbi:MAG: pyridoxamine 5'-phosphate oxidase family protein [Steroidobacteraceae bacterium]|jgi:hypothetical protein|nr:pyridoxamine 5'-phosphate oxidase family protein [Steroidobacteraceae bacterium]
MGKLFEVITPDLKDWIERQRVFFVATAPLAADGHVNCSPKGLDTLRILGPREVAYLDLTGSGAETIAHLRENGRIVVMFCALEGPPRIVRLHGRGSVVLPDAPEWARLRAGFPEQLGDRAIIRIKLVRISDSCGFGVPLYEFVDEREALPQWCEKKGTEGLARYQRDKNAQSIDGLPSLADPD